MITGNDLNDQLRRDVLLYRLLGHIAQTLNVFEGDVEQALIGAMEREDLTHVSLSAGNRLTLTRAHTSVGRGNYLTRTHFEEAKSGMKGRVNRCK